MIATPLLFACPHFTVTAGVQLTDVRCGICTPKRKVTLRVEYFVATNTWDAERLTDALADSIAATAEEHGALANGGVCTLSLFEQRHHDGMDDPEYRAGAEEAENEVRAVLYRRWLRSLPLGARLREAWAMIVHLGAPAAGALESATHNVIPQPDDGEPMNHG